MGTLRVGTSGWSYKHWKGAFYPEDVAQKKWLESYARRFDTVEINASFYRLPRRETFEGWAARVPESFVFAVKASRYVTHVRRLNEPAEPVERLVKAASGLGDRLGPILFQLPPAWDPSLERIASLADSLPRGIRVAVEFRDPRLYRDEVLSLLSSRGMALVVHDHPSAPSPRVVTASFAYARLHGSGDLYHGRYGPKGLRPWAEWIGPLLEHGMEVYVYFNNDAEAAAPRDALELIDLCAHRC